VPIRNSNSLPLLGRVGWGVGERTDSRPIELFSQTKTKGVKSLTPSFAATAAYFFFFFAAFFFAAISLIPPLSVQE
jgi:hypothetical protein